jgi:hypothetical protein
MKKCQELSIGKVRIALAKISLPKNILQGLQRKICRELSKRKAGKEKARMYRAIH